MLHNRRLPVPRAARARSSFFAPGRQFGFPRTRRIVIAVLFGLVGTGCGMFGNKDEVPEYKMAKVGNPLEVPPDLRRIPQNEATAIPSTAPAGVTVDDEEAFQNYQKYEQWSTFEEFERWKASGGADNPEFRAFAAASGPYAELQAAEDGSLSIFVRDGMEGAWETVTGTVEAMDLVVHDADEQRRTIEVSFKERRYNPNFASSYRRDAQFDIVVSPADFGVLINVRAPRGAYRQDADKILSDLYDALRATAAT